MSIVTCPGCNRAFTAGRSMSVHLFHSLQCRAQNVPSSSNLPYWLVPDELPFQLPPLTVYNEQDSVASFDYNIPDCVYWTLLIFRKPILPPKNSKPNYLKSSIPLVPPTEHSNPSCRGRVQRCRRVMTFSPHH